MPEMLVRGRWLCYVRDRIYENIFLSEEKEPTVSSIDQADSR